MENNNPPKECPIEGCGGKIIEKQGISKEGRKYHFWGCANFASKGCTYTWPERKKGGYPAKKENDQGVQILEKLDSLSNAIRIINDNIKGLHQKIDKVTNFFVTK